MYCKQCGQALPDGAKFCTVCGKPVAPTQLNDGSSSEATNTRKNSGSTHLKVFTLIMVLSIVALVIYLIVKASYDLSGTYQTSDFFPINQITYDRSGHFTAVDYNGGYTYTGKYKKQGNNEYSCVFTDGYASGGSPVTDFEASSISDQYELSIYKIDSSTIQVEIIPSISYLEWAGQTAYFYSSGY